MPRTIALTVVAVVLLLTVAAPAVAAGNPPSGSPELPCPVERGGRATPTLTSGTSAVPELRAVLGVLRRPQAPGDRAFGARDLGARTVFVDLARFLGTGPGGTRYFVVPAKPRSVRFEPRCKRRLPSRTRRRLESIERASGRDARRTVLKVVEVSREGGSEDETTLEELLDNAAVSAGCTGERQCARASLVSGLVPDGVAAVRLRFRGGLARTVPVTNNLWVTEVPIAISRIEFAFTDWLDPTGTTIKSFDDRL